MRFDKKLEYILLGSVWLLSLLQYSWLMGKEERGEVPEVTNVRRTPFTSWVVGTMLVLDCDGADGDVTGMALETIEHARAQVRLTGVVLRYGCDGVRIADVTAQHPVIRLVAWFSPLVSAAEGKALKGGLLSDGKVYNRRENKRGLSSGHLIDFDSEVGRAWVVARLQGLIAQGVRGVYCDPVDHVLLGSMGEHTVRRYVNQRDYSRAYYWGVFDAGRELLGYDFVVLGAGVSSFGTVTGARLMPTDRGMASVLQVYNSVNTDKEGLIDTVYAAFKASQYGYINFATAPIPAKLQGGNLEEKILSVQLSAALPLLLISHSLADGALPSGGMHPAVVANAALHGELQMYLHGASSQAAQMNTSIVTPTQPLGEYEAYSTPTEHSFYLGSDIFVCPLVDTQASVACRPPDGGVWKKATTRADATDTAMPITPSFATAVHVLKRVGTGLPIRPYGKISPLLWSQYGMPSPGRSTLTLLFDSPQREAMLDVLGPVKRQCLQVNVTVGEGGVKVRITPWDDPLLVVLRNVPVAAPKLLALRYKREPVNTTSPLFQQAPGLWGLHAAVGDEYTSTYHVEGRDVFVAMPAVPRGATVLLMVKQ